MRNWKLQLLIVLLVLPVLKLQGAPAPDAPQADSPLRILLWPEGAPGALGTAEQDQPLVEVYLAPRERATGAAMVVCPGGGYHMLAPKEGVDYARWLNELGISAFVLQYRLGSHGYRHPAMLDDAARAVRLVRSRAAEWHIDGTRIGIIGSSAGGHLASTLATHFDAGAAESTDTIQQQSSRPDIAILCYPVISIGELGHVGSKRNLLGLTPSAELVSELSNELQVTTDTPPCFLFHTADDAVVDVRNSLLFSTALADHGVTFSLHVYPHGRHGIGLGGKAGDKAGRHPWVGECEQWLREVGFIKTEPIREPKQARGSAK